MKRLFLALKIHPDNHFFLRFENLRSSLAHEQIKWVDPKNIHITLKFFGETKEEAIPSINSTIATIANTTPPFKIQLHNLGVFGSYYNPRVIWTGIEPYTILEQLMQNINRNLENDGFLTSRQNSVPHLTLGRIKNLKDKILFRRVCENFRDLGSEPEIINELILFESILHKEGPEYKKLKLFALK